MKKNYIKPGINMYEASIVECILEGSDLYHADSKQAMFDEEHGWEESAWNDEMTWGNCWDDTSSDVSE